MSEVLDLLPEIAIVSGYVGGLALDHVAGRFGDAKRTAALHTQGVDAAEYEAYLEGSQHLPAVAEQPAVSPQIASKASRLRSLGNRLNSPAAYAVSAAALVSVLAFHREGQPHQVTSPILEMDVDHPYGALQDGTYKQIDAVAGAFAHPGQLRVQAEIAHDSIARPIRLSLIQGDVPNGPVSLDKAVTQSLGAASATSTGAVNRRAVKPNVGLLVITDDDPIGATPQSVVTAAGGVPISIVNEGVQTDQTAQDLMLIAKQTHGKYYGPKTSPSSIVKATEAAIPPKAESLPAPKENDLWLKIASLMSSGLALELIRRRAELHFKGKLRSSRSN